MPRPGSASLAHTLPQQATMFSAFCAGRMLSMVGRVSSWMDALLESKALRSRVVTTRPPSKLLSADRGLLPRLRAVEYRVRCCAAGNASSVALSSPCWNTRSRRH
ncbi:hypothetical protein MKEN_01249000 [Mycena kentingensis (nom. inval.)]|nr:hypothetical protein MKEN_01249000 [Mycena kentingensis (nom. inval.)]